MTNEQQGDIEFTDDELNQAATDPDVTADRVAQRTGRDINEVKTQLKQRSQTP